MKKMPLVEALELVQEMEFMAGPGMMSRPDYTTGARDPRNAQFNFKPNTDKGEDWPYEDDGYMQYGRSMGNKGRDRGSRPGEDMSGGPPTPKYQNTWEGAEDDEDIEEGADFDELERHGEPRNKWKDTPDGKQLRRMVKGELENDVREAMGVPFQTGPVAPMDGLSVQSSGRDAKPVKDTDGDDVSPEYIPDPVDPMRGPGNMWGGPGMIPGATRGWANSPSNQKRIRRENLTMKLREFFDPSPIAAEAIDNPDEEKFGDQTDDEVEDNDGEGDGFELELGGDDDEGIELHGSADADGIGQMSKSFQLKKGDDGRLEAPDPGEFKGGPAGHLGPEPSEPGDGDDLGEPDGTIVAMPHLGHGNDFVQSPDKMGSARGTFGMHSDSMGSNGQLDKRSAWDVLSKVVNAMGEDDDAEIMPRPSILGLEGGE